MPASVQNILVLGAGELGMSVLHAFAEKRNPSTRVTVMLRPGSIDSPDETKQRDQRAIRGWGFNILPFDVSAATATELTVAMERFDLVISCTGFSAGAGTQVKIAQAVLAARVKKFVPWQFGVDYDRIGRGSAQDLFDEQLQVRDLLRNQRERETNYTPATQWKIISTGIFCSFLFEPWFGIVEPQHSGHEIVVRALGSWENAVTVTTVEDIGTLTVEVVLSPEIEWDSVTFVAGDTITYGDLARFVQEAAAGLSSAVQTKVWSSSYLEKELLKDPTSAISKYRVVFAAGVGVSWDKKDTWNARNSIKTTSVAQWLAAHLSVLVHQEV